MKTIYFTKKDIAPIHDNDAIKLIITKEASKESIRNMVLEMEKSLLNNDAIKSETLYFTVTEDEKESVICEGESLNGNVIFYNAEKEE